MTDPDDGAFFARRFRQRFRVQRQLGRRHVAQVQVARDGGRVAGAEAVDGFEQLGDARRVARQRRHALVRHDQIAHAARRVLEEAHGADVVLGHVVARFAGGRRGEVERGGIHQESHDRRPVLDRVPVHDALHKSLKGGEPAVRDDAVEVRVEDEALCRARRRVVERDVLRRGREARVGGAQGAGEAGLLGGHEGQRRGDRLQREGRRGVVGVQRQLPLVPHDARQRPREQRDVERGFEGVGVEFRHRR